MKNPTVVAQNGEDVLATRWSVESPGVGDDIPLSWLKPAKWLKGRGGGVEFERPRGFIGVNAPQGQPELSENEFSRFASKASSKALKPVMKKVNEALRAVDTTNNRVAKLEAKLSFLSKAVTIDAAVQPFRNLCGICSPNWRRVAYIDTTRGPGQCPSGLVEHVNSTTNQRACGRTTDVGCSSVTYPAGGNYTNICGRVRGYQFYSANAFEGLQGRSINGPYVDGISITRGSPRQHVWTYAAYHREGNYDVCPCGRANVDDIAGVPAVVFMDFYCETAFAIGSESNRTAWENPLWDGAGSACGTGGQCCATFGWFHKTVSPSTSDHIEVRWCADQERSNEDVLTELVEIWVM